MRCFQCKGPYHPAPGHYDHKWDVAFCGACYRPFTKWLAGHMKREWGGANLYEEAATSIRPGIYPPEPYVITQEYRVKWVGYGKIKKSKCSVPGVGIGPT